MRAGRSEGRANKVYHDLAGRTSFNAQPLITFTNPEIKNNLEFGIPNDMLVKL